MAMFCQNIVEQTDRRYRRYARVLTYRLEWTADGRLRWQIYDDSPWTSGTFRRNYTRAHTIKTAVQNARKHLNKAYPVFVGVRHNSYLTPTQARRLAFMAGVRDGADETQPPPAWMAMDWIRERVEHPRTEYAGMSIDQIEQQRDAAELEMEHNVREQNGD